ncbi:MAG: cytochrome c biogenesis protein CcsA [Chloroflexi bacterium]|jgi:heme exporter protein C|nr:cytochrome c biogenesis protein CcsA [Chloroflexota bacterium]MBT7080629.1 cytochrome c biogenesis protein CcsA [Chloroflexota bacterium]MBT7289982.1 cytochrome c biogenesis protein CcsA [Chloroflexota bacterium]
MKERIMQKSSILPVTSVALLLVSVYLILGYVPTESTMGWVQRVFYFHVPIAWLSYLAFFIVFVCSIFYLSTRERKWDIIARSAAEVGVVFTALVLVTGSIWAKSSWGTWWEWNERLTSELVLWLVYIAYLMVRSFATEEDRGARSAAVIGIAGFFSVPISALSIRLWDTVHPQVDIFKGGLAPEMLFTLLFCIVAFTVLFVQFLLMRISMRNVEVEIAKLRYSFRR